MQCDYVIILKESSKILLIDKNKHIKRKPHQRLSFSIRQMYYAVLIQLIFQNPCTLADFLYS